MHRFDGTDAVLYAAGDPFRFENRAMVDCGDGFEWRAADESLRYWLDAPVAFEVAVQGRWVSVGAVEVEPAAAQARFDRCLTGQSVRASGTALPVSRVADAEVWQLEQEVLLSKILGDTQVARGQTRAMLQGVREATWDGLAVVGRVLTVLPSATAGAFVGLGQLMRDAAGVTVLFDEQGVSYAPR